MIFLQMKRRGENWAILMRLGRNDCQVFEHKHEKTVMSSFGLRRGLNFHDFLFPSSWTTHAWYHWDIKHPQIRKKKTQHRHQFWMFFASHFRCFDIFRNAVARIKGLARYSWIHGRLVNFRVRTSKSNVKINFSFPAKYFYYYLQSRDIDTIIFSHKVYCHITTLFHFFINKYNICTVSDVKWKISLSQQNSKDFTADDDDDEKSGMDSKLLISSFKQLFSGLDSKNDPSYVSKLESVSSSVDNSEEEESENAKAFG